MLYTAWSALLLSGGSYSLILNSGVIKLLESTPEVDLERVICVPFTSITGLVATGSSPEL